MHQREGIEKGSGLAVFPISEIGFQASSLEDQRKYVDFIIKHTSDIPNIILTHSFYPHSRNYATQPIKSIREIINKNIEKKIWYGNSRYSKNKPDLKLLNELSKRIRSGLILIFKIVSETGVVVDNFTYTSYLIDIDNNKSFKEVHFIEQSSSLTNFATVEMMTKKLFESYLSVNSQTGTNY